MNVYILGSNRIRKIIDPLQSVGVKCYTKEDTISEENIDIVITDVPGTTLFKSWYLKNQLGAHLIYRMRGNYWQELKYEFMGDIRARISNTITFSLCDSVCVADSYLASEFKRRTSFNGTISVVGIPKDVEKYTVIEHVSGSCKLLTLTNFNYREKVSPIYEYLEVIDEYLSHHIGHWYICGEGEYSKQFETEVQKYDHITYEGYVNAPEYLSQANILLHFSEFDIGAPNAILEGLASGLPVITNDFPPFEAVPEVITVSSKNDLRQTLDELCTSPDKRREIGKRGRDYVRREHNDRVIGNKFVDHIRSVK